MKDDYEPVQENIMSKFKTISIKDNSFFETKEKEIKRIQDKMDSIARVLTSEQLKDLEEVINWIAEERVLDDNYSKSEE